VEVAYPLLLSIAIRRSQPPLLSVIGLADDCAYAMMLPGERAPEARIRRADVAKVAVLALVLIVMLASFIVPFRGRPLTGEELNKVGATPPYSVLRGTMAGVHRRASWPASPFRSFVSQVYEAEILSAYRASSCPALAARYATLQQSCGSRWSGASPSPTPQGGADAAACAAYFNGDFNDAVSECAYGWQMCLYESPLRWTIDSCVGTLVDDFSRRAWCGYLLAPIHACAVARLNAAVSVTLTHSESGSSPTPTPLPSSA